MNGARPAVPAAVRAAILGAILLGTPALAPLADEPLADEPLTVSKPYRLSPHVAPGEGFMGIRLLGSVQLDAARMHGLVLGGLSGLAWDEDESRLYALSDRGALFHLRPHFADGRLQRVDLLAAFALRDARGRALNGRRADAEALQVQNGANGVAGDSRLAVSFERYPRVVMYTPDGRYLEPLALPPALRSAAHYADTNKALEALCWLPGVGFLTAPEQPRPGAGEGIIDLYALDGRHWAYPLRNTPNAALVDMQALPDGSILTLERGHGLMFLPMVISLRETRLPAAVTGGGDGTQVLEVTTLAILDSSRGWSVDNFEGLTRHRGLTFFMVSDDNFNALQKTLLVYFERATTGDEGFSGNIREYELRQQTRD